MDKLVSRKFILAVLVLVITATLCFTGDINGGVYSAVIIATVGAYITGNVFQKNQPLIEKNN